MLALGQALEVLRGVGQALGYVAGEMAQLGPKQRGVQWIHPKVAADGLVVIFRRAAVHAEDTRALGQVVAVSGDHAAIAKAAEILGREKTECAQVAHRANLPATEGRAHRLRGVLEHGQAMCLGQALHAVHVRRLAKQMHRDDRLGVAGNAPLGGGDVDVEIGVKRVDEHRRRAGAGDRACGCKKRERRAQHLVAGADAQRHQRKQQRVGAGADPNNVPRPNRLGGPILEPGHLRPEDELRRVEHAREGGLQLSGEWLVLCAKIEQRDVDRFSHGRGIIHRQRARAQAHCR